MDSLWYQDPLMDTDLPSPEPPPNAVVPGWWWRDTTNQNAIVGFYDEVYPQIPHVETVAAGVYCVRGVGVSNMVALVGETEWVLIDAMDSPQAMQLALLLLRPYVGTRHLVALIYTGESSDHYSGSSVVGPLFSIPVYSSADFFTVLSEYSALGGLMFPRSIEIEGAYLESGWDGKLGTALTIGRFPFHYPNQLISVTTTISKAGFDITLIPVNAPSRAGLLVWLPEQDVIMIGDAIDPNFPNLAPLNGPPIAPKDWITTLNLMLDYTPESIVPHHGPVITSEAEAARITTMYTDAIQYVYDRTIS
jgi:alkyl sulfatase BDS1-like metallo-beta-lactamase superfamily hydrolase